MEEFGAEFVSSAIGAVEKNAKTRQIGSGDDAAAKKVEIFGVERRVGDEEWRIFRRRIGAMLEDIGFERFFDGIGELHASVRKKLYAVVVVRIVRGGNNDPGLKIILANEAGNTGRGDDASKGYGSTGLGEPGGEESSNVGAGFAGVQADEDAGGGVFAQQIGGERAARGEKSAVVERWSARNAANTVCSEKFFGHERLAAKA